MSNLAALDCGNAILEWAIDTEAELSRAVASRLVWGALKSEPNPPMTRGKRGEGRAAG